MMMLNEMLDAARRGVKVRLLLDDHGTSGLDQSLSALEAEPNIESRPFNRFGWRAAKLAGFLFDFARDVARDGTSRDGAGYRAI